MAPECRKYCLQAVHLSEQLIRLAHKSGDVCNDDRCQVLFGIVLDSASKIRLETQKVLENPDPKKSKSFR